MPKNIKNTALTRWKKAVIDAIKDSGQWGPAMALPAYSLASAFATLEFCNRAIARLDLDAEDIARGEMPAVFKVQRDAIVAISQQLRTLKVTTELAVDSGDNDPLIELAAKIADITI